MWKTTKILGVASKRNIECLTRVLHDGAVIYRYESPEMPPGGLLIAEDKLIESDSNEPVLTGHEIEAMIDHDLDPYVEPSYEQMRTLRRAAREAETTFAYYDHYMWMGTQHETTWIFGQEESVVLFDGGGRFPYDTKGWGPWKRYVRSSTPTRDLYRFTRDGVERVLTHSVLAYIVDLLGGSMKSWYFPPHAGGGDDSFLQPVFPLKEE